MYFLSTLSLYSLILRYSSLDLSSCAAYPIIARSALASLSLYAFRLFLSSDISAYRSDIFFNPSAWPSALSSCFFRFSSLLASSAFFSLYMSMLPSTCESCSITWSSSCLAFSTALVWVFPEIASYFTTNV